MIDEEGNGKEYRWETGYEKTWEAIVSDDTGKIDELSVAELIQKEKRKRQDLKRGNRRLGLMRHLYLVVDCSEAMLDQDLNPNRQLCTVKLLEGFIDEFFEQNPIAQMGVIITRNKRAEKLSDLAGISKKHSERAASMSSYTSNMGYCSLWVHYGYGSVMGSYTSNYTSNRAICRAVTLPEIQSKVIEVIKSIAELTCTGQPSLQNALELAGRSLKLRPSHASREVLVIMANLTTCDPGNIAETIKTMKEENIRCSVIGLAAEVYVYKTLTKETNGTYSVILDDSHFKDQIFQQIDPPPVFGNASACLIKMGFPHHTKQDEKSSLGLCMCHLDDAEVKLKSGGYKCPQCAAKYCELPVECKVCSLTLVSAPHLARSFLHLFPVESYEKIERHDFEGNCFGCQRDFAELDNYLYRCNICGQNFCAICDIFVHDTLRTCPGCAANPSLSQTNPTASHL